MKKLLLCTVLLALPMLLIAQNKSTNFFETLNKKGYTEVEWTYLKNIQGVAKSLDACSRSKQNCNLKDPVKNLKANALKQMTLGWSFGVEKEVKIQKNMAAFEKAMYNDPKNDVILKKTIDAAFAESPGYSYKAMSARMDMYIKSMERVFEDDE